MKEEMIKGQEDQKEKEKKVFADKENKEGRKTKRKERKVTIEKKS